MPTETREEAARSQRQIEKLAALANQARVVVKELAAAFDLLEDWPDDLDVQVLKLQRLAQVVATEACEWAEVSNADLDLSDPSTFTPANELAS